MASEPGASEQAAGGKQPNKPAQKPRGGFWRWFILHVERKMHQRRAHREKKRCEEKPEDKAARRTATATVWIAIFTVLLAGVGGLTLFELIEGGADTKALVGAAGDQADAAQQFSDTAEDINGRMSDAVDQLGAAASNAKSGIQATQDAMRLDQRAWMGLEAVTGKPEEGKVFDISLDLRNTGRTPAENVIIYSVYQPVVANGVPNFGIIGAPEAFGFVSPNALRNFIVHPSRGIVVPKDQLALIQRLDLYVHGILTYVDIFKKKHWFTYCLKMESDGSRYDYCPSHNDQGDGDPPFDLTKASKQPN